MTDFVHLHCHSHFSLLDGMSTPEEIAQQASTNGQYAAAITDHGSMAGVFDFQEECRKKNVKPIFGIEAYFVPDILLDDSDRRRERFHCILLAKNQQGVFDLFSLSRKSWGEGFYYKPRIDFNMLQAFGDNIICLSGCLVSAISQAIVNDRPDDAEQIASKFLDIFGDNFYFEVQPWNPKKVNDGIIDLAASFNRPVTATIDCHFPGKEHASLEEVLLMVGQFPSLGAPEKRYMSERQEMSRGLENWADRINFLYPDRFLNFTKFDPYIMSGDKVIECFDKKYVLEEDWGPSDTKFDPRFLETSMEIAERCTAEIPMGRKLLPSFSFKTNSNDLLKKLAFEGLDKINKTDDPVYVERLEMEVGVIEKLDFADYFLMVWDICNWADKNDVARGPARGSAAGSLLAYVLGIVKVDPIPFNLLFARFLNEERNDYPDIDLDFADKHRIKVKNYIKDRWGHDNVAAIATFGEYKAKSVVKDVGRVFGIDYNYINNLTSQFDEIDNIQKSEEGAKFVKEYPEVIEASKMLEGRVRNTGAHAAGMVVSRIPLDEVCPIETRKSHGEDGRIEVIATDMNWAEKLGLIKLDILGLKAVSVIDDCIKKINEIHGVDVSKESTDLDDHKVFENFNAKQTVGVFQAEGGAYTTLLNRMSINSFDDLAASNALARPGALVVVGDSYIARQNGKEKIDYPSPVVEDVVKDTYGLVIYQEQLMEFAVRLADFTWSEADRLRKIIGKKKDAKEFFPFREKFIKGASKHMSGEVATDLWDGFEKASLYMFNKSHAVAYSVLSYQTMWLKTYYPTEFIWSLLTNESTPENVTTYLLEAFRMGIKILPPDVNISGDHFTLDSGTIRFGLGNVFGCGNEAVKEIIAHRPYANKEEFLNKVRRAAVKSNAVENLEKIGAFESTGHESGYGSPEKYYLPILGFPVPLANDSFGPLLSECAAVTEGSSDLHFVRGLVKSVKRTKRYLRVEIEDASGVLTAFGDKDNHAISKRDYVLALVGDNTLHDYIDASDLDNYKDHPLMRMLNGMSNPHTFIYGHGFEHDIDAPKSFMYLVNTSEFKTKKGDIMGNIYVWDTDKFHKAVVFPKVYGKHVLSLRSTYSWFGMKFGRTNDNTPMLVDLIPADKLAEEKSVTSD